MDSEDLKRDRETVPSMQEELRLQISNLKAHIDGVSTGKLNKLTTSVNHERTAEEYGRERELLLKQLAEVPGPRPLCIDWERNEQELKSCLEVEHTPDTLPILLHQFFCDRVSYLIHLKHILLVRWARFGSRPSVVAKLNDTFQELMTLINSEYDDFVARTRRLSVARDCHLATKPPPLSIVQKDDVLIYLRWLVSHLHSTKRLSAAVSLIRWIPHAHLRRMQNSACHYIKDIPALPVHTHYTPTLPPTHPHHMPTSEDSSTLLGSRENKPANNNFRVRSNSLFGLGLVSKTMPELSTVDTADYQPLFSHLLKTYNLGMGLSGGARSAADELEMYYQVEQKFHVVFRAQERLSTYHAYGMSSEDPIYTSLGGNNGRDALNQKVFRKPSNWLEFNTLKAAKHPLHVKAVLQMRDKVAVTDPLLSLQSKCLHMSSEGRTLYALKQHVVTTIYHRGVSSLSTKTEKDTLILWKGIYQGLDTRNPLDPPTEEEENTQVELDVNWDGMMRESSNVFMTSVPGESGTTKGDSVAVPTSTTQESPRMSLHRQSAAAVKPRSGFTVPSALKLMTMDKGREISARAHSAPKNGFFAFVLLRHMHTRDLMRKCVGVLNYLRSVERTLVINCGGLSLNAEGNSQKSTYHSQAHLYHTPADYRIDSEEFMRFKAVENHDDFYSSEDGLHRVSDAKGVPVVYDIALEDMKSLESELLLLGSYYLQKTGKMKGAKRGVKTESDVEKLSCFQVDRFAILLDLWTCEEQYQQAKKKLVDCYMEAYHLTPDPHERSHLASVIYDIISSRPRYNPDAAYFSTCYHDEIDLLRTHSELMESILSRQLMDEREYCQLMGNSLSGTSFTGSPFGMPLPLVAKQQASLIGEESTLCPAYLLEVCPSLSMASHLYYSLKGATEEAAHLIALAPSAPSPNAVSSVALETAVLQLAQEELDRFTQLGSRYSRETQKQLFSEAYIEHPGFVSELCAHMDRDVMADDNLSHSEKLPKRVDVWCRCLEGVSLRHRLLLAAQETEVAHKVYRSQLEILEQDSCHAHLRTADFDHLVKLTVTRDLNELIKAATNSKQDEASLDRYTPAENCLGIHELDSSHIGKFSFQTRNETLQQLSPTALENLRTSLVVQVSSRQCLTTACQHHTALLLLTDVGTTSATDNITASTRSLQLGTSGLLQQDSTGSVRSFRGAQTASPSWEKQLRNKFFVSIQRYKAPLRDLMLSEYTEKPVLVIRSPEEASKARRELIVKYCFNVSLAFSSTSLKTQLLHSYTKLSRLLEDCPAVREAFFVCGKPKDLSEVFPVGEVQQPASFSLVKDPRQHQARPHSLMSGDGRQLTNLWYIPHPTEVVKMFTQLDSITDCRDILTTVVKVATRFVHIVMHFCAYAQLGVQKSSHHGNKVGAEWGGLEGIGRELSSLSDEISRLEDATDPQKVCCYLEGKCRLLSWCLHLVVQWCLPQTFFSKGKKEAYHVVCHHSAAILDKMSDKNQIILGFPCFSIPEPVDVLHNSHQLSDVFSWRKFLSHSQILDPLWKSKCFSLKDDIHSLLGLLPQEDRLVAQGDIIGMSVQVDEALQSHHRYQEATAGSTTTLHEDNRAPKHSGSSLEKSQALSITGAINKGLKLPAFVSPAASLRRTPEATSAPLPSQLSSSLAVSSAALVQSASHRKMKSGWLMYQPSVAMELALKYVTVCATVETLKWEWSARVLGSSLPSGHVKDSRELHLIQEMYKMRVHEPSLTAVKSLAGSCSVIQGGKDGVSNASGPMDDAGLLWGKAGHYSELQLVSTQCTHLTELLRMQLIREQIRHVTRLQTAVLAELEQDEDVLPITVWKKASFKEPPAVMKPRIGEVFHSKFLDLATTDGGKYSLSKKDWTGLMSQLETSVLTRERELYDIYSTFYEAILMHLHISHFHMERELEHYKAAACAKGLQSRDEARVLLAQDTRNLTLEITALRTRIAQLEDDLVSSREGVAQEVQSRYKELVERTFSSAMSIKSRFEDYRQTLYGDCLDALQDVRHEAAASMAKMRQRLCLDDQVGSKERDEIEKRLKGVEIGLIQKENSALANSLSKINVVNRWHKNQLLASHEARVAALEGEVDRVKRELTESQVTAKEEKRLLRQQVDTLQKVLFRTEKDVDAIQKQLTDEKNKRIALSKSMTKSQDSALVKPDTMQELEVDDLVSKLEEKEQQLKALREEGVQQKRMAEAEQLKARRAVKDIKKQLYHERGLKLDAFHHFEDMVAKAHGEDMMQLVQSPPQTADTRKAHCSSAVISRPKANYPVPRRNKLKNHSYSDFTAPKQDVNT